MTDDSNWDEERYENDSFENESDSEAGSETEYDVVAKVHTQGNAAKEPSLTKYYSSYSMNRLINQSRSSRQELVQYASSSDEDEADVVFSKTIAEINTEPMCLENVLSPQEEALRKLKQSPYIPYVQKLKESTDDEYYSKDESDANLEQNEEAKRTSKSQLYGNGNISGDGDHSTMAKQLHKKNDFVEEESNNDEIDEGEEDDDDDTVVNEETDEPDDDFEGFENFALSSDNSPMNFRKLSKIMRSIQKSEVEQSNEFPGNPEDNAGVEEEEEVVGEEDCYEEHNDEENEGVNDDQCINGGEFERDLTMSSSEYNHWKQIAEYETDIVETSKLFQSELEDEKIADSIKYAKKSRNSPSAEKFKKEINNYKHHASNDLTTVTEAETEAETEEGEAEEEDYDEFGYQVGIQSNTPSGYNSDFAFHLDLVRKGSNDKYKKPNRKSWSFTNERVREIERQNHILLKKILTQKPTYAMNPVKKRSQSKFASLPNSTRVASAAVNRKKQQRQIDLDNLALKRRIEAIQIRRPKYKN